LTATAERRPWGAALLWLAVLTPFFFLSYGFAAWVTSQRRDVPSLVFGWEHRIPFLAWTIVPYWSTDLLYALSLFLCRNRKELNTHARRLLTAQIICMSVFLLFPLRFTFERPPTTGLSGWMFDVLLSFDKPFNQAPSLHLALTTILWAKYSQHLAGPALWLTRGWFLLVGLSTLTTYQHHFIDLPTGIWVGLLCLALFPDNPAPPRYRSSRNRQTMRVGAIYLAGSLLFVALAIWIGGAAWWLLWPVGALLIVAAVYWSGRPELFGKVDGAIDPVMVWLLAPYLAGAWLNSRWWTRADAAAQEIASGVWLGRMPRRTERDAQAIASMVDLTAELPADTSQIVYRGIPMLDSVVPSVERLEAAVQAIEDLNGNRPTLVCCALGYSRSAAASAAWLVASGKAVSIDHAIESIQARRWRIVLGPALRRRLEEWASAKGQKDESGVRL
jgi:protein-tyrosine phosphatase